MKKVFRFISEWIWQFPQNFIGFVFGLFIDKTVVYKNIYCHDYDIINYDDCCIYKTNISGGITLGKYIYIHKNIKNFEYILKHEHGHVVQSKILGPLYLIVIGIPSLIWATIHTYFKIKKSYYSFYTEAWANKISGLTWK